jgi:hypothetical protein
MTDTQIANCRQMMASHKSMSPTDRKTCAGVTPH